MPKVGTENLCRLLDCVSYRSGTRFFWYQILEPVGCVFYFMPISGMHVTIMATGDERNVLCTTSRLLVTITSIDEMDSLIFASSMLIFCANLVQVFGAKIWSVCHQLKTIFNIRTPWLCLLTLTTLSTHFSATNIPTQSDLFSPPSKTAYIFCL